MKYRKEHQEQVREKMIAEGYGEWPEFWTLRSIEKALDNCVLAGYCKRIAVQMMNEEINKKATNV